MLLLKNFVKMLGLEYVQQKILITKPGQEINLPDGYWVQMVILIILVRGHYIVHRFKMIT
ncbi:hypothetical protein GLOIN_2v1520556 [Rhizophagus irregularis DAOM 181602=DAOM 197198]|uniref:Uncharacterized protein n=1 Tax=Rhizophagus irregularis (strain DAOM 181602 / DAOM 197198 / MUCL 43194) TaxID=747089 RepID=A0A2P4QRX3_RHIID|nr:hypothetical protein GLOIN_2v1520556 [Rhizophagus irregularis DAOM 181602=DAOM 197198]POG80308.1 hypothetical protein GLOIN_2v1520556 [Rhizophagus irregularis DAOM 181602=DAOM 197198]|eukprot:XP_025187174.1 hypothetical protein GLOIN_2v1520556 [Rhizophagus irregularis DAOM 181602=DAOM 197198]